MAKYPNHFISGKPFHKRPNGNHGKLTTSSSIVKRMKKQFERLGSEIILSKIILIEKVSNDQI